MMRRYFSMPFSLPLMKSGSVPFDLQLLGLPDQDGKLGPEAWPVHASLPLTYQPVPDIA